MLATIALSVPIAAQWPPYSTSGVPRRPDGKPNLAAPAPRTADGKPDFSGLWEPVLPPVPPANPPKVTLDQIPRAYFFDVTAGLKGELPLRPFYADVVKKRQDDDAKDTPNAWCLPLGIVQFHTQPEPRKIIQTPTLIVILYEANYGQRELFMDGRPLPRAGNNLKPRWYGYSIAKWQGDTLVVQTTGFRDDGWLDARGGHPLTSGATVTERWRRPAFGRLEIDVTIDDPKAYTKPFTIRVDQQLLLDVELNEHICVEGDFATTTPTGDVKLLPRLLKYRR
jgi:hypothetical protein